jgi:hypothetical protein
METEMILKHTHEEAMYCAVIFRFTDRESMARVTGKSVDLFNHELPTLANNEYLKRVTREREITTEDYAVYMIGKKGIPIINRRHGISKDWMRYKRVPKERGQNDGWKWHEMMNSKIMHAIYAGTKEVFTPMLSVPRVSGQIWQDGELHDISIKPDYGFTLEPYGFEPLTHYHETDTGEEPGTRTDLIHQRSPLQKCLVYLSALKRGEDFSVTLVTSSRNRAFNMMGSIWPELVKEGGEEYEDNFMINDFDTLLQDSKNTWCTLAGNQIHLLGE